jgi:hypothetical protein
MYVVVCGEAEEGKKRRIRQGTEFLFSVCERNCNKFIFSLYNTTVYFMLKF